MSITIPSSGVHSHIDFGTYLRWPFLSQSTLKEGRASMSHMKASIDRERVKEPTDEMILGSALHVAFLEPELMPTRVVKWDGARRAGKEWTEFTCEHAGKIILTAGMYENLIGMVRSLRKHPEVKRWQSKIQDVEVSAIGSIDGVPFKGRTDALTADPLVDLKKVRSADPFMFTKQALAFGYDIQAYIYRELFNRDRFMLIAVEDSPPYDVVPFELTPGMLRHGEREAKGLIQSYKLCTESGVWPGRSDEVVQLELPEWAAAQDEANAITIDGHAAFSEE